MSNMEWIETTGKTVAEAREHALDQLRVDESEIEFEVVEEPKSGLFGRTRGIARVKARVAHKAPRPKTERRKRTKKSSDNGGGRKGGDSDAGTAKQSDKNSGGGSGRGRNGQGKKESASKPRQNNDQKDSGKDMDTNGTAGSTDDRSGGGSRSRQPREPMEEAKQIEIVEQFLSGLLDSFGLSGELNSTVDGKDLVTNISGENLGVLVGPRLATLEAVQELARLALQREANNKEYARVTVDVADIRQIRRDSLESFVRSAAERARDEGQTVVFEEMSSADRKQVHDLAATIDGVKSVSEGEDPRRRVALVPEN